MKKLSIVGILLFFFTLGCQEEIDLKVDLSEEKIVFDGWVTSDTTPYTISVSKSTQVFDNSGPKFVENALLIISSGSGISDTLIEVSPGQYETTKIQGELLESYHLFAEVEGEIYEADAVIPRINTIDFGVSTYLDDPPLDPGYYAFFFAQEAPGPGDYYWFRFYENDSLYGGDLGLWFMDDAIADGEYSQIPFPNALEEGDTITLEVYSLTQETYDYFILLSQDLSGAGSPFGAPPTNLKGNISNGALGYFGTAGVARKTIITGE